MNQVVPTHPGRRWAAYFAERFPLGRHSAVVGAFVFGTLAYAGAIDRSAVPPSAYLAAFVIAWLLFLELRIADEFKDAEDDARYRPYRPVPRGLVTLRELGTLAGVAVLVQVAVATWAGPAALAALLLALGYLGLMTKEFFVRSWLRRHPVAYLASHSVIVPLIAAVLAACSGNVPLRWHFATFLALAYTTSVVFEIGRKIRSPVDEREGVEMYSALWGTRRAVGVWLVALAASAALSVASAQVVGALPAFTALGIAAVAAGVVAARRFLEMLRTGGGDIFAAVAGAWLVVVYVALGVAALLAGQGS